MNLNKEQYKAAVHVNGPMLVLAGPGSGKTHLLVERIQMMIEKAGIPPESILVITFSKKAAAQMQARFERRTEGCMYPVTFGTFHAVFFNILKDYDPDTSRLITEEEAERFAEHLKRSYDIFEDDTEPGEIIGLISSYRNLSDDFFTRNDRGRGIDEPEREAFIKLAGEYAMLCKNAGVIDMTDDEWDFTIATDETSVFKMTRAFASIMKERSYGRIINIASMYGLVGNTKIPTIAYHASKGAVVNFTRATAAELAPYGITCNCICPGYFETELTKETLDTEDFQNFAKTMVPMGRYGQEGELNPAIIFLASEEASYVTGAILPVDGGYTAI